MQQEQQKRIVPKFDEEENKEIDEKIKQLVRQMTQKIKTCESNIKLITNTLKTEYSLDEYNKTIIKNMQINLADKIKDFTFDFRKNEQKYINNYKELVDANNTNPLEDNNNNDNNFLQTEIEGNDVLIKRDKEISVMLKSLEELTEVFKDMQHLVEHQGTILDRIDFNIETTLTNTQEAHKHLKKAEESLKGNCFRNSILLIITIIFIEAMLIIFKYL